MNTTASKFLFIATLFVLALSCSNQIEDTNAEYAEDLEPTADTLYAGPEALGELANTSIDEASGLVASRTMPGTFWTHNDSGGENALFLLGQNGEDLGKLVLGDIDNRDWEDIAIGPGPKPNTHYIYVAEMGDNEARYTNKYIYRLEEPTLSLNNTPEIYTASTIDTLIFQYPDGPRDAEALLIHPITGDVYIVTKREVSVHVYTMPAPHETGSILQPEMLGTLPFNNVNAGDISPDGNEVLLKDYWRVYHWIVKDGDIPKTLLEEEPVLLPYEPEPQGEAIAFDLDMKGYYTVSEERNNIPAVLYRYPRKED